MTRIIKSLIASSALAAMLTLSGSASAYQAPGKTATKPAAGPVASEKEIADAKSKGLVWTNASTKVYHKDGQFYGKTKQGKFMTEADALKAGYRAAKDSPVGTKKPSPGKK